MKERKWLPYLICILLMFAFIQLCDDARESQLAEIQNSVKEVQKHLDNIEKCNDNILEYIDLINDSDIQDNIYSQQRTIDDELIDSNSIIDEISWDLSDYYDRRDPY